MRKMRNWQVWGVLGLLLALGLVVGYGQVTRPIPPPPEMIALKAPNVWLTTVESVKSASFTLQNGLELFLVNLDMHAWRNLQWQVNQTVTCGGLTTKGVGYFFPSAPWERDYANVYATFTQSDVYVFGAWFIPAPGQPVNPQVADMKCSFGLAEGSLTPVSCGQITIDSCTVFWFAVQIPGLGCPLSQPNNPQWCQALWDFKVANSSMMFVRATITKGFGGKPSPILLGRPIPPPLPPPGEGAPPVG